MRRFGISFVFTVFLFSFFMSFSYGASRKVEISKNKIEKKTEQNTKYTPRPIEGNAVFLEESFAYVLKGHEKTLLDGAAVSDVGYFAAEVNSYGELVGVPLRTKLSPSFRVHLVVVCNSLSLSHMILNPSFKKRERLIEDLLYSVEKFDGLQIDFELIPKRERANFHEFLRILSAKVKKKGKIFSVCVPARIQQRKGDIFDYEKIASLCDKVVVMAYDEHWAGSPPGAVSSLNWGRNVARYAIETIGSTKLLMGLPFYGRSWASEKTATAWYYSGAMRLMRENNVEEFCYKGGIPYAKLCMNVDVELYFDDAYSLVRRLKEYESLGVKRAAFWCMGQEDKEVWKWIFLRHR